MHYVYRNGYCKIILLDLDDTSNDEIITKKDKEFKQKKYKMILTHKMCLNNIFYSHNLFSLLFV